MHAGVFFALVAAVGASESTSRQFADAAPAAVSADTVPSQPQQQRASPKPKKRESVVYDVPEPFHEKFWQRDFDRNGGGGGIY